LTFPRVYKEGHPKTFERDPETNELINVDKEATEALQNRPMPTEQEIDLILAKADKLEPEYFKLRAKAIIALIKIFGKRRAELGLLEPKDLTFEGEFLYVFFTICKKSKRGLFQYLKFLKKQGDPALLDKPLPVLEAECREWNKTKEGSRTKLYRRQKATPLSDKFAKLIIAYYEYMKAEYYDPATEQWKIKFLFPSGKEMFGADYYVSTDKAISGRQLLAIYKELDPLVIIDGKIISGGWLHLYRKLKGSQVARKYGRTLDSAYQVKTTLDLERTETALRYIEDFVPKLETGEIET
jgi:hypothetical protein